MTNGKKLCKKILLTLLTVLMLFSSVPTAVFAEGETDVDTTTPTVENTTATESQDQPDPGEVNETPPDDVIPIENPEGSSQSEEFLDLQNVTNIDNSNENFEADLSESNNQNNQPWNISFEDITILEAAINTASPEDFNLIDVIEFYKYAEGTITLFAYLLNDNITNFDDFINLNVIDRNQFENYYYGDKNVLKTLDENIELFLANRDINSLSDEEYENIYYLLVLENRVFKYLGVTASFNENGNLIFEDEIYTDFPYLSDSTREKALYILKNTFTAQAPYGNLTADGRSAVACACNKISSGSTGSIVITYTNGGGGTIIEGTASCTFMGTDMYEIASYSCSSSVGSFYAYSPGINSSSWKVDGTPGVDPTCKPVCVPCSAAGKCSHGYWYLPNATAQLGAPVISGGTYFCIEPYENIDSCCSYSGLHGKMNISEDQALRLAILFQNHPEGGVEVAKCVWNILGLGKGSVPGCAYDIDPDSANSTHIQTHGVNMISSAIRLEYGNPNKNYEQNYDGEGNLGRTYWSNTEQGQDSFKIGNVTSGLTAAHPNNAPNANEIDNTITHPYPLKKTVEITAGGDLKSGELAGGGTVQGVSSDGCQDFLYTGQFTSGNLKYDRFQPTSYTVTQKYGSLKIVKIDERTGSPITSATRDEMGNLILGDFKFKIYVDCSNNNTSNSKAYCGLDNVVSRNRISGSDASGNYPAGTELHYMLLPSSVDAANGSNNTYTLSADGSLTIDFIPVGQYYIKEVSTHDSSHELNPNYYQFTISDQRQSNITHVSKSNGTEIGGGGETPNFPNMQYAIITLDKEVRNGDDVAGGKLSTTTTDKFEGSYKTTYSTPVTFWLYIPEGSPLWGNSRMDMGQEITYNGVKYHRIKTTDGRDSWTTDANGHIQAQYIIIPRMPDGSKVYDSVSVYWREAAENEKVLKHDLKLYEVKAEPNKTKGLEVGKIINDWYGSLELYKWSVEGTGKGTNPAAAENLHSQWTDSYQDTYNDVKSTFWLYIDADSPLWKNANKNLGTTWTDETIYYPISYDIGGPVQAKMEDGSTKELRRIRVPNGDTSSFVDSWTTDANGKLVIKYLPAGKYYLKEHETSYPYKEDEVYHDFTIQLNKRTYMKAASESMGVTDGNEIERRFSNDRYGVLEIKKWTRQISEVADCDLTENAPAELKNTYKDEFNETYEVINEFAVYVDAEQAQYIRHVESLSNGSFKVGDEISGTIKTKYNSAHDNNIAQPYETVRKVIPASESGVNKELYLVQVLKKDTNYTTDGITWYTKDGYSVIKYLPKGDYYLKEISTNEDIFELNPNYEPFKIEWNKTTQMKNDSENNREYNNRLGVIRLFKYDEDSDNDLPRLVTKTYCAQGGEDDAYCDEIDQVDAIDIPGTNSTRNADQLDNLFVLLSNDENILNYRSGMYDGGAYAVVDEDGEFIGYATGVNDEGEPILTMDPNEEGVFHSIIIPDTRTWAPFTYHNPGNYPKMVSYTVDTDGDGTFETTTSAQMWRTNDNGEIVFKYLPKGDYYLKEHSTDIEIFALDEAFYKYTVEFNRVYSATSNLSVEKGEDMISDGEKTGDNNLVQLGQKTKSCRFLNAPAVKTGGLEFVKLDEEGHNVGTGHKFEIWYINNVVESKKAALAINPATGKEYNPAKKDIGHSFELARTKTAKKRYLLGYYPDKTIDPDNVQFQIRINSEKSSEPGKYVYKGNGNIVSTFETDEDGRIYIERLPIGTYVIKEVETREDSYDLTVDNYGDNFYVRDDQGKVYDNAYIFTVDYKMVTCLNGADNPKSTITGRSVCKYTTTSTQVESGETIVYKNTKGVFNDEFTKTNQVEIGRHNKEVTTTYSFNSFENNNDINANPIKTKVTRKGIVNEWAPERGSFELIKKDEYGNTSEFHDLADKIFEIYYLKDADGRDNEVFSRKTGKYFISEGTYDLATILEYYNVPESILNRISTYGDNGKAAALSIQVEDVYNKGHYEFKHWDKETLDFDAGTFNNAVHKFVTGEDGKIIIDQMPVGEYLVIEIGTTNAFLLNNQGDNTMGIKDGVTTTQEIIDYFRNVDIEVNKMSSGTGNTQIPLDDARFVVYDVTATFNNDYSNAEGDEVLFVRKNATVDLYNLLIKGRPVEEQVNGRSVKYSLGDATTAVVDANGMLTATDTGLVKIDVLGGVHSLYGNVQNRKFYTGTDVRNHTNDVNNIKLFEAIVWDARANDYVTLDEGVDVKFYKDAAKTKPLDIEAYEISVEDSFDKNTPGIYTLTHNILTKDHVIYTFNTTIEMVQRDQNVCSYYPSLGQWLKNGRVCDTDREPDYTQTPEINFDKTAYFRLVNAADDSSWNDTPLGSYDVYVISNNDLATKVLRDPDGKPIPSNTIVGTKVFEGITGHITLQLQDSENHNYPSVQTISAGLDTYLDKELTQHYKHYDADEYGMVDLTEDAGKVDKLYFRSFNNQDGYYLAQHNVVEIDMSAPKPGWLQIKNLKHSRKYIICEKETPNGFTFSRTDNACRFYDTGDQDEVADKRWGVDVKYGQDVRVIYRNGDENILTTLVTQKDTIDEYGEALTYDPVMNAQFSEDNQDRMIVEDKNYWNALLIQDNWNEAKPVTLYNDSDTPPDVIFHKYKEQSEVGPYLPEDELAMDNAVFDIWEVYSPYRDLAKTIYKHYTEADRVPGKELTKKDSNGNEVNPKEVIGRFVGRYSSGSVYHQFFDDSEKAIAGKKVLVSTTEDMKNVIAEGITDENGVINIEGLGNQLVFFQLERPLKDDYDPCYEVNGQTYCNSEPSDSDYVPLENLPSEYSIVHEMMLSHGMFSYKMLNPSSILVVEELLINNLNLDGYAVPDNEVAYIVDLAYSGFDFNQSFFHVNITNLLDLKEMGTNLFNSEDNKQTIVVDDEPYTLTDHVGITGVKPETNFTLKSYLVLKSTGEIYEDGSGNKVIVETPITSPAATDEKGLRTDFEVDVDLTFDPSNLKDGDALVAFEELINERGTTILSHKDLEDTNQTVTVTAPSVGTRALETEFEDNILEVKLYDGERIKVSDIVTAKGLRPGKTYKVCGYIYNKKNGEDLANSAGLRYYACSEVFTATENQYEIDVPFTLDTDVLGEDGLEIVVFEDLYKVSDSGEKSIAEHKDPTDKGQTLTIKTIEPKIGTTATDNSDGDKVLSVYEYDPDLLEIKDVVVGENIKGNRRYVLYGWLMNKNTGKAVYTDENGQPVKVRKEFEAGKNNLESFREEMILTVNSDDVLTDQLNLVVFEELYVIVDGKEEFVADHKKLDDVGQTVVIKIERPTLGTKALDPTDADQIIDIYTYDNDVMTVNDELIIENIKPNRSYVAYGTLFNKATGELVKRLDGSFAKGKVEFDAKTKNLSVFVDIDFDTDMVNVDDLVLVAFEELYIVRDIDGEEVEVFVDEHKDEEAEEQFITIKEIKPEIHTLAYDAADGDKVIDIYAYDNGKFKVADKVLVERIKPSETITYVLEGTLFNKKTGKMVYNLDGSLAKGRTEFKADKSTMEVVVEIEFDSDSVNMEDGLSLVAFEVLKVEKPNPEEPDTPVIIEIGKHEDPTDEDQTIVIKHILPKIRTKAYDSGDGDKLFEKGGLYKDDIIPAIDTVIVEDIKPGVKYLLEGYFVDETGKEVKTGDKVVVGSKEITPEKTDFEVDVEIPTPVKDYLKDSKLVAFETLYILKTTVNPETEEETVEKIEIAEHKDLKDEDQSVTIYEYPKQIKTILAFENGKKTADPSSSIKLNDVVKYEGLVPGKKYKLVATVIDKATDAVKTTGELEFTVEKADGEVTVKLKDFNSAGMFEKELVCYEELYEIRTDREEPFKILEHKDKNDKDQTVKFNPDVPDTPPSTGFGDIMNYLVMLAITLFAVIIVIIHKKRLLRNY